MPITEWKEYFSDKFWIIKIPPTKENKLSKVSGIDVFQIKSFDKIRFNKKIGVIDTETFQQIKKVINLFIEI